MTARVLPDSEWHRLDETDSGLQGIWPQLNPLRHHVIAVEDDGKIVGTVVLMEALHAEFLWIDQSHRGHVAVQRALKDRLLEEARDRQSATLLAGCLTDQMRDILAKLGGTKLPGGMYVIRTDVGHS